jgi:transposase
VQVIVNESLSEMADDLQVLKPINGRPSIPHEMVLRTLLLQALYSLHSERLLMEQMEFNQLFRWFVGLPDNTKIWDATVFAQNRERLLRQDVSGRFLDLVMKRSADAGLLSSELFSVDSAILRRWAAQGKKSLPVGRTSASTTATVRRQRGAR